MTRRDILPIDSDAIETEASGNDIEIKGETARRVDVPILVYHRIGIASTDTKHPDTYVQPRAFARQLAVLKALGYQAIAPADYLKLRHGIPCRVPPKPVLITFDDGSATVYSEALPLLSRYGFPAVLFMVSSHMGKPAVWDGETDGSGHRQLTPEELRALKSAGWAIGSHTVTHARLTSSDDAKLLEELTNSKKDLEAATGGEVPWFAYPYGDFTPGIRDAVARAGYQIAFATEKGDGNALSIPRRIISGRAGLFKFVRRLYQARALARL